jgi:hypothetical protein
MDFLGYVLGVLAHVAFKWSGWKTKDREWGAYWREYAGLNISGGIAAVVCFGLWGSGAIPSVLNTIANGAAAMIGHADPVQIPTGFWGALGAGYILDSAARTIFQSIEKRSVGGQGQP